MKRSASHAVSLVGAAYDLRPNPSDWLHNLLESARPLLDQGLGCAAAIITGARRDRLRVPLTAAIGSETLQTCLDRAIRHDGVAAIGPLIGRHGARTLGGRVDCPIRRYFSEAVTCRDVLEVWGVDCEARGVVLYAPSPKDLELAPDDIDRWHALASHIAAAYRIRRGLGLAAPEVTDSVQMTPRVRCIRKASIRADRTSNISDAQTLANTAKLGVMYGKWSMVDWFDANGRRFVLVRPNSPGVRDPRALSLRERQVATYAAQGDTGKIVGYRLGISPAHVSNTLRSAMRKLKVKTHAQLVIQMRCLDGEG